MERFHKTLRAEFFNLHVFETIEGAQAGLDAWVAHYNYERDHQSIGDVPPATRFALAAPVIVASVAEPSRELPERSGPPPATRRVDGTGSIGLARHHYHVGRWLAGGTVEVHCHDSLVEIVHRDQLVVTHVARHQPDAASSDASRSNPDPLVPALRRSPTAWSSLASSTEEAQSASPVHAYKVGKLWARRSLEVAIVANAGAVLLRRRGHPHPSHPSRPAQGARRLLHSQWPAP
ncbi:MAG TPA: integrase core domain-containing protein [Acidimicrobiales bacterium]|nr:integrase core domain-containing protein [Acidimicrobiales bacterium]